MLINFTQNDGYCLGMGDVGSLGSNIRRIREAAGLNQDAVAKAAGITQKALSEIENGKRNPHPPNLAAIAKELGCSVDQLRGNAPVVISAQSQNVDLEAMKLGLEVAARAPADVLKKLAKDDVDWDLLYAAIESIVDRKNSSKKIKRDAGHDG